MQSIPGHEIKLYVLVLTLIIKSEATNDTNKNYACLITNLYGLAEYLINAATFDAEKTITRPIANKIKLIKSNTLSIFLSKLPRSYCLSKL